MRQTLRLRYPPNSDNFNISKHFSTMVQDNSNSLLPKLVIVLVAISCVALIVALYHCIRVGWTSQYQENRPPQQHHLTHVEQQSSVENSIAELIPVHKFIKSCLDVENGNDHTCSICLCEFEEGEELRTLPECSHSFHVSCIDMWFHSHTSCPMCRIDATPSWHGLMHYLESDSERPAGLATRQGVASREI